MFFSLDGPEGGGKSTQITRLAAWLADQGKKVLVTREPGDSLLGRRLRQLLLEKDRVSMYPNAELLLFLADRAQHVAEVIAPALARGETVLCDRYEAATYAYQGYGRGLAMPSLRALCQFACQGVTPDLTLLLLLPPAQGLQRARRRNANVPGPVAEDHFDRESLEFHRRVADGYLALAREEPRRYVIINASVGEDMVFQSCCEAITEFVENRNAGKV